MTPHRSSSRDVPAAPAPLPIPVVDNHVHLDIARDGETAPSVSDAVKAASAVGVTRLVQVGCDLPGARFTVRAVEEHAALLGGIALHPNEIPGPDPLRRAARRAHRDRVAGRAPAGPGRR